MSSPGQGRGRGIMRVNNCRVLFIHLFFFSDWIISNDLPLNSQTLKLALFVFFSSRIYLVLFYDFYWRSSHLLCSLTTGFRRKIVSPVWLRLLRLSMESPALHLLFPLGSELLKLCAFSEFWKARPGAWEPPICSPWGWCPNCALFQSCSQVDFMHVLTSPLQKLAFIIHQRMLREPAVWVVGKRIRVSEADSFKGIHGPAGGTCKQGVPSGLWGIFLMEFVIGLKVLWVLCLGYCAPSFSQSLGGADHLSVLVWVRKKGASWAVSHIAREARHSLHCYFPM